MDEQAQGVRVRRRRSRAEVAQLVAEYEASGLGRVEFCREHGLSLSTLARYRKWQSPGDAMSGSRWVTVEVSRGDGALETGGDSGLALALTGGRRIEIGRGFNAPTLTQLLRVLEHA